MNKRHESLLEQQTLLAIIQLSRRGEESWPGGIAEYLEPLRPNWTPDIRTVSLVLKRMKGYGWVTSKRVPATTSYRTVYSLTAKGIQELRRVRKVQEKLWEGVPENLTLKSVRQYGG